MSGEKREYAYATGHTRRKCGCLSSRAISALFRTVGWIGPAPQQIYWRSAYHDAKAFAEGARNGR